MADEAIALGREIERAAIAAFLRSLGADAMAGMIEAGKHLEKRGD